MEKKLEVQGVMALRIVDLEKTYNNVPREMDMTTLRWIGVSDT